MATRKIVKLGDDILRKKCREVDSFDDKLASLISDMAETMYRYDGVGLAASQVGILRRVFVVDIGDGLHEFVNPTMLEECGTQIGPEGCLSISGQQGTVCRPKKVKIKAFDRYGKEFTLTAEDYFARAICHENDHLDGVLYIDKISQEEDAGE